MVRAALTRQRRSKDIAPVRVCKTSSGRETSNRHLRESALTVFHGACFIKRSAMFESPREPENRMSESSVAFVCIIPIFGLCGLCSSGSSRKAGM